ncbi:hypothetical protein B0H13DRAFT_2512813 [Mycena leptocephala]|nr:hypothetical protein B0H13DRAFT_2512813 [Mycena leptocephala]
MTGREIGVDLVPRRLEHSCASLSSLARALALSWAGVHTLSSLPSPCPPASWSISIPIILSSLPALDVPALRIILFPFRPCLYLALLSLPSYSSCASLASPRLSLPSSQSPHHLPSSPSHSIPFPLLSSPIPPLPTLQSSLLHPHALTHPPAPLHWPNPPPPSCARSTRASSIPRAGWRGWGRSAAVHGRGSEPPARRRPPRPARAVLDPHARAGEGGPPPVAAHARGTTTSVAAREGATSSPRARARPRLSEWAGVSGLGRVGRGMQLVIARVPSLGAAAARTEGEDHGRVAWVQDRYPGWMEHRGRGRGGVCARSSTLPRPTQEEPSLAPSPPHAYPHPLTQWTMATHKLTQTARRSSPRSSSWTLGSSSLHRDHATQQAADTDAEAEETEPAAFEETAVLTPETNEVQTTPYPHIFAIGDAADAFGALPAGHSAWAQGEVAGRNVLRLIGRSSSSHTSASTSTSTANKRGRMGGEGCEGKKRSKGSEGKEEDEEKEKEGEGDEELETYTPGPPAIKVSLGLNKTIYQVNGTVGVTVGKEREDLNAAAMWAVFGCPIRARGGWEEMFR